MADILICGVVRNCESNISSDVSLLSHAFDPGDVLHWLFVESDSDDGTITELERLGARYENLRFHTLGKLREHIPLRTQRIAHCRNRYLELIESSEYSKFDFKYIVIADFDGINNRITSDAIASCEFRSDWDVCTANQSNRYYDIWALRHHAWSPVDCYVQYKSLEEIGYKSYLAYYLAIVSKIRKIGENSNWIQVESAFSGLAIYRPYVLKGIRYKGTSVNGEEICEHVSLHSQITSNGFNIFINPQLIAGTGNEHSRKAIVKLLSLFLFGGDGFNWLKSKAKSLGLSF